MIEIILTIGSAITASGLLTGAGIWIGKTFKAYITERDTFRDQIHSLQAQVASQDATIAALQEQILAQVRVSEQQDATIKALETTLASKKLEIESLLARITKLEETIRELTHDKAVIERERDALRGDEVGG